MKKLLFTLAVVCFSLGFTNAQSNEGHIKYAIEMSSDNPEMQMQLAMMNGSTMEIYFQDKNSSSTMRMGSMMTINTITSESGDVLMLMGGMMGKKAIKTTVDEMKGDEKVEEVEDIDVQFVKGSKTVAGYKCKKAIIETEEGDEVVFWYTEELKMGTDAQGNLNGKIPGVALAFETNNNGMIMSFEATEVENKIKDKSVFSLDIPEGYEEMTYEQLKGMGM
ncbi:MAG TPA: hypothetical protein EYG86_01815 [Crocinitomicaceae bacterium]|nr:hypothetical protein [Crocinitomicaceae bacterium]